MKKSVLNLEVERNYTKQRQRFFKIHAMDVPIA